MNELTVPPSWSSGSLQFNVSASVSLGFTCVVIKSFTGGSTSLIIL